MGEYFDVWGWGYEASLVCPMLTCAPKLVQWLTIKMIHFLGLFFRTPQKSPFWEPSLQKPGLFRGHHQRRQQTAGWWISASICSEKYGDFTINDWGGLGCVNVCQFMFVNFSNLSHHFLMGFVSNRWDLLFHRPEWECNTSAADRSGSYGPQSPTNGRFDWRVWMVILWVLKWIW